jgi:predicted ATPase
MPHYLPLLAMALEIAGQTEEATASLNDALDIAERTGERWFESELNRYKAELLLRQGDVEAAEELFRKAMRIARGQQAKQWELRAAISLARLHCARGYAGGDARDILAPVYGWFTEGFDTLDLKEAKTLLEELVRLDGLRSTEPPSAGLPGGPSS